MTNASVPKSISIADMISKLNLVANPKKIIGEQGELVWVDPGSVHIDYSFQREVNVKHVMKMADNYNHAFVKAISLYECQTTGLLYATDGQHSLFAAKLNHIPLIPAYKFKLPVDVSYDEIKKLMSGQFIGINKGNKKISQFDVFRNQVISGLGWAVELQKLCDKHGVTLLGAKRSKRQAVIPGSMTHISNLIAGYTQIGAKATDMTLGFMRKYWPNEAIDGVLFLGLCRFFRKFSEAKLSGIKNTDVDHFTLYRAASLDGFKSQEETVEWMEDLSKDMKLGPNVTRDTWMARGLKQAYNSYIVNQGLDVSMLLSDSVVGK